MTGFWYESIMDLTKDMKLVLQHFLTLFKLSPDISHCSFFTRFMKLYFTSTGQNNRTIYASAEWKDSLLEGDIFAWMCNPRVDTSARKVVGLETGLGMKLAAVH